MKASLSLLTLALSVAITAPAFARDDAVTNTNTYLWNEIEVKVKVKVQGEIDVNAESAATVDQDQIIGLNRSVGDGDHTARIDGDALRRADGNIGVNLASGVGNAQSNDAAISTITRDGPGASGAGGANGNNGNDRKKGGAMATAMVFSTQATGGNSARSNTWGTNYTAELEGNALQNVQGNIGLNIAAGVGNGQSNAMAAAVADGAVIAKATSDSEQVSLFNELDSSHGDLDLVASIGGNALQNASGNIGVNVASGVGNLQHNGLAIASSSCKACGN
ncbi:MAG: hypothetical protein ACOY37_01835 [Pseudomonadota bacterium]